ncbi:MAG: hypothetical protein AAF289_17285, partial [Cyanobacteria bacterium P01_A01_bin.135]
RVAGGDYRAKTPRGSGRLTAPPNLHHVDCAGLLLTLRVIGGGGVFPWGVVGGVGGWGGGC